MLSNLKCGVAEEVIDGEQLGKSAGLGISLLGFEHGVAESLVASVEKLVHERFLVTLRGLVQAETARGESGFS